MAKSFDEMSNDEIQRLIRYRYNKAVENGTIKRIVFVVEELGEVVSVKHSPGRYKELIVEDTQEIRAVYCRDSRESGSLQVFVGKQQVCRSYLTCVADGQAMGDRYFLPGPWVRELLAFEPEAIEQKRGREQDQANERAARHRQELLDRVRMKPAE